MTEQTWIFSVRYYDTQRPQGIISLRRAVIGPARPSTIEAALQLAKDEADLASRRQAHQAQQHDGDDQDAHEHQERHRRGVSEVQVLERLLAIRTTAPASHNR